MKNSIVLVCLSMFVCFACSNTSKNDPVIDKQLSDLLENKELFKLRNKLNEVQNNLSDDRILYYEAYCSLAFGEAEKSNEYISILLDKYKNKLSDSTVAGLLEAKASNCIRLYQYKETADIYKILLEQYQHVSDSSEMDNYKNVQQLFATFANVKPQLIHKQKDCIIQAYHNQFNHLMTPVKCGGISDEFIFDSGANLSTISYSYAKKMGLTIFKSDIEVGSSTGIIVQTQLAVADSLYVGDLLFENVIFLVSPDEQMSFPSINYEIHGIVGFPVIHQMGEIRMHKEGTIEVPLIPVKKSLANMYLEYLNPIVQLVSNSDTLLFTLDTGARNTELSKKYYDSHKAEVEKNGKLITSKQGGAGGFIDAQTYVLQNFPYTIGTKRNVLSEIPVMLKEFEFNKNYSGNLGQDVFMQFNKMILNFQYMYIDFE